MTPAEGFSRRTSCTPEAPHAVDSDAQYDNTALRLANGGEEARSQSSTHAAIFK